MNFLVLVYSGLDSNLASAILKLGNLTADGIEDFAAIDSQLFDNSLVDPKATIQRDGTVEHVHLLHWLAHNKSNLSNLRVVGVAGGNNDIKFHLHFTINKLHHIMQHLGTIATKILPVEAKNVR